MQKPLNLIKLLCSHSSTDVTRFHLNAVHFDGEKLYSTDGHRMLVVPITDAIKLNLFGTLEANVTYDAKPFSNGALCKLDCKYPNVAQLVPDFKSYPHCFETKIPDWVSHIKKAKRRVSEVGLWITETGHLSTGGGLVCVNGNYLGLYAVDSELKIYIKDSTCPIVLEHDDFTAVLMPLRGEKWPVKVTNA